MNHEIGVFVYHLSYADEKKNRILCIVEEITKEISFKGFLRRTENYSYNLNTEYTIIHFDIRGFKAINDQVGFDNGNSILCEIYRTMKTSKLEPIIVSRSMGDHFYCLIERKKLNYEEIARLCEMQVVIIYRVIIFQDHYRQRHLQNC